jgi:murein DD-endopeptidase MepM/ murein hydrolase activator NlpD
VKRFILGMFLVGAVMMTSGCQQTTVEDPTQDNLEGPQLEEDVAKLPIEIKEDGARFKVDDLIQITGGDYSFDELHRTLEITVDKDQFYLIDEVPVLERNGEYLATDRIYLIVNEEDEVYLPTAFIEEGLNTPLTFSEEAATFSWFGPTEAVGGRPEAFNFEEWNADQMVAYLDFLEKPIAGAEVSTISAHLPGAPRAYRNGFHEGIDWYDFSSGGNINTDTPIYAMGEGIVVRADQEYEEYSSPEVRNQDLALTAEYGETPEYIFDRLRGRQVWVQYPNGVMNRFAHLDDIPEDLNVGDRVNAETIIGYVGNSGTSGAVNQDLSELHLHQDLLIYGELFWKPLSQEEVREVLLRIWE